MTTPKDNALHLMEGQGLLEVARLLVAFDFKSAVPLGDIQAMARTAIAAHERQQTSASPKTALQHFADEVEASGEAEKHAAEPVRAYMDCEDCSGTGDTGEPERYMGEFQPPEGERCGSCNGSGQWGGDFYTADQYATLKALYEKSQELFARERGITKDLAAALQGLADEYDAASRSDNGPGWDAEAQAQMIAARAALSKVQHVAARGAEVSE